MASHVLTPHSSRVKIEIRLYLQFVLLTLKCPLFTSSRILKSRQELLLVCQHFKSFHFLSEKVLMSFKDSKNTNKNIAVTVHLQGAKLR